VKWTIRINHWINRAKFATNRSKWKEEDIEPAEDLLGDQVVEDWDNFQMKEEDMPDEKVKGIPKERDEDMPDE
jgi:hypothetical protein